MHQVAAAVPGSAAGSEDGAGELLAVARAVGAVGAVGAVARAVGAVQTRPDLGQVTLHRLQSHPNKAAPHCPAVLPHPLPAALVETPLPRGGGGLEILPLKRPSH
jgi:hypothetical protein